MTALEKQAIRDAHDALTAQINSVVGCAMFAPDSLRQADLPALVNNLRQEEQELLHALEGAGVWDDDDYEQV